MSSVVARMPLMLWFGGNLDLRITDGIPAYEITWVINGGRNVQILTGNASHQPANLSHKIWRQTAYIVGVSGKNDCGCNWII